MADEVTRVIVTYDAEPFGPRAGAVVRRLRDWFEVAFHGTDLQFQDSPYGWPPFVTVTYRTPHPAADPSAPEIFDAQWIVDVVVEDMTTATVRRLGSQQWEHAS